ncbi:Myb/SANT-like DNA-binding domain-containing protein [Immersiella caudata]|uniref:Myb/SANT-like DNA-binding domain-containing protein n=1 Tax=Immersiella caudata TaxID=314043 RepID=A0AA39WSI8_9PEZI|nr:Myb/SANT-like DNA-binding domain-containing protein [Immersiella caudata]
MSDEDYTTAGGANNSNHTPGKHRGPRFSWTPAYEATFFRSLVESTHLNLREGSTFKQEAWDRAIQALIEQHNAYPNKNHLINKSDNARKKFRLWRGLRENPEFHYDRATRMVTASEDAWKRHIEKEPLSRSLKGRPFEHEEYYEHLFQDVIGSGGAPKRLTKPRRKDNDMSVGLSNQDAPGTTIMDLMEANYVSAPQTHIPPPSLPSASATPSLIAPPLPSQQHPRSGSTVMPPRASIGSSALTPPEDPSLHTRKRFQPPDNNKLVSNANHQDKRRRTAAAAAHLNMQQPVANNNPPPIVSAASITSAASAAPQPPVSTPAPPTFHPDPVSRIPVLSEGGLRVANPTQQTNALVSQAALLAEALRGAKLRNGWSEQALEIFFREFSEEDMDLQLKIAEKVLTDDNKAMVFCKMTDQLRNHWVRRLREMHNQRMN